MTKSFTIFGKKAQRLFPKSGNAPRIPLPHNPEMRKWLDERLKELRDRGMKKNKVGLAKAMNLTPSRITEILNGDRRVYTDEVPAMARYLEWTRDELMAKLNSESDSLSPVHTRLIRVPLISWVQAGKYAEISDPYEPGDSLGEVFMPYGKETLIALMVRGNSTNRVAPDGSTIVIDFSDKTLIDGKLYVIRDGEEATCKRYRANPDRFEPDSTDRYDTIFPTSDTEIVGRVVKVLLDP